MWLSLRMSELLMVFKFLVLYPTCDSRIGWKGNCFRSIYQSPCSPLSSPPSRLGVLIFNWCCSLFIVSTAVKCRWSGNLCSLLWKWMVLLWRTYMPFSLSFIPSCLWIHFDWCKRECFFERMSIDGSRLDMWADGKSIIHRLLTCLVGLHELPWLLNTGCYLNYIGIHNKAVSALHLPSSKLKYKD